MTTKAIWRQVQRKVGEEDDGLPGRRTARAVAKALGIEHLYDWPNDSVDDLVAFYGQPGENLEKLQMPFPLKLSWNLTREIDLVSVNQRCYEAFAEVWNKTLEAYGRERISELSLDVFGGCYNKRFIGHSKRWSVHAFGAAWDIDPDHNAYSMHRGEARLSGPEYDEFWEIVESVGGTSLGRARNYDWMHFQFADL